MEIKDFFIMEIEGVADQELAHMHQGITWPALMALNSSLKLEDKIFRETLLTLLKKVCDQEGMMPFFMSPFLQKRYPPDLESTALFVSACALNREEIITDLDDIKKKFMAKGFFQTWTDQTRNRIDYTSQLIMCMCYGAAGMNVEQPLEKTIKSKFKNFASLYSRDVYYANSLYFNYFTLYLNDKGVLPNNYHSLMESFIEAYVPTDEVEASMIQKICINLKLTNPCNLIAHKNNPIFTNGSRQWIKYHSRSVKEIFRESANLCRRLRFNHSK